MKINYGLEYTEKDYENLTKSTTNIFAGLGTVLVKAMETFSKIEEKRMDHRHTEQMKEMDHEILRAESEIEELKQKLQETDWEVKKLSMKMRKSGAHIFETETPKKDHSEDDD